jgi:steroid delta-isomerase
MTNVASDTPSPDFVREVFAMYAKALAEGDADALVALFAPEGTLEDPVGSEPHRGREAIGRFFRQGFETTGGRILFRPEGPVRINGRHAACAFVATCDRANPPFEVDTLDIALFDDQGRIESMVAILGPSNFRRLDPSSSDGGV